MTTRTITLTGRPPVNITEEDWPIIASAADKDYDNQYEFQANRTSKVWLYVRQHADGRAIVYAKYTYCTAWTNERQEGAKHGMLLDPGAAVEDIVQAIYDVASRMPTPKMLPEDTWDTLPEECIAELPAESI